MKDVEKIYKHAALLRSSTLLHAPLRPWRDKTVAAAIHHLVIASKLFGMVIVRMTASARARGGGGGGSDD